MFSQNIIYASGATGGVARRFASTLTCQYIKLCRIKCYFTWLCGTPLCICAAIFHDGQVKLPAWVGSGRNHTIHPVWHNPAHIHIWLFFLRTVMYLYVAFTETSGKTLRVRKIHLNSPPTRKYKWETRVSSSRSDLSFSEAMSTRR